MDKRHALCGRAGRTLSGLTLTWVVTLVLLPATIEGGAPQIQQTSEDTPTFVSPPQLPTEVAVGAYLISLDAVSEPSEPFPTYEVEMFLNLSWVDPRLAYGEEGSQPHVFQGEEAAEKLSEIWSPDVLIQNEVEPRELASIELTIFPDGRVDSEERFGAILDAEFDLRRFPFDTQTLDIELQSFIWDQDQVIFVGNEKQTGFDRDFTTLEWSVTSAEGITGVRSEIRDDREFSSYTLRLRARRLTGHYLLRFTIPLLCIMVVTWFAFWEPAQDRFRVGFLALLTVVATHTVVSTSLPRLNYPTLADIALLVCYFVATALIIVSVVVQRAEARGAEMHAREVDRAARWLLPLVAVLVFAVSALLLWF